MIELPPLGRFELRLWHTLLDIYEAMPMGWTLIGGQMVFLHALEHERTPARVSEDLDVVVDARVRPPALRKMIATITALGFRSVGESPFGVAHRYRHDELVIDVLAPDGVGARADLRTSGAAVTVEVGGGTFALSRTVAVGVRAGPRTGSIPRPDLAGALVVKAAAAHNDKTRGPARHLRDLAMLLSLVDDPIELRDQLGAKNCKRISNVSELHNDSLEGWAALDERDRQQGRLALRLLSP